MRKPHRCHCLDICPVMEVEIEMAMALEVALEMALEITYNKTCSAKTQISAKIHRSILSGLYDSQHSRFTA